MLFSDQRHHSLALPAGDKDGRPCTIASLIDYLCQNVMKDTRQELFVLDGHLYVTTFCLLSLSWPSDLLGQCTPLILVCVRMINHSRRAYAHSPSLDQLPQVPAAVTFQCSGGYTVRASPFANHGG